MSEDSVRSEDSAGQYKPRHNVLVNGVLNSETPPKQRRNINHTVVTTMDSPVPNNKECDVKLSYFAGDRVHPADRSKVVAGDHGHPAVRSKSGSRIFRIVAVPGGSALLNRLKQAFRRSSSDTFFGVFTGKQVAEIATAEMLGTGMFVFMGCMGCVKGLDPIAPSHLQIALTFGLAVGTVIQIIGHISKAHLNPAVTVCSWLLGHVNWATALAYMLAQCIGATLGYGLLKVVTPISAMPDDDLVCVTVPHDKLTTLQAVLAEFVISSILIILVCAVWDRRNASGMDSVPLKFGFAIATLAAVEGHYTGASMNPARSLGPAIWNNSWQQHWVYWVAPVMGSFITTLFYMFVFGGETYQEEGSKNVSLMGVSSANRAKNERDNAKDSAL